MGSSRQRNTLRELACWTTAVFERNREADFSRNLHRIPWGDWVRECVLGLVRSIHVLTR